MGEAMKHTTLYKLVLLTMLVWSIFFYFVWTMDSHSCPQLPTSFSSAQATAVPVRSMLYSIKTRVLGFREMLKEEYFTEGSRAVHGLWNGHASADMLSFRLQEVKNNYISINLHNVTYKESPSNHQGAQDLMCQLKQQQLRTVDGSEEPFTRLGWRNLVPAQLLQQLPGTPYRTCAVVTSAGALLRSSLGKEIDSHDAVLRFNAAPTQGFEEHVGSKTTIRIINSQVLAVPYQHFAVSSLYKDIILVAWDPTSYSANLENWYRKPDFDLFTAYMEHRKLLPLQPFYILHPGFIWRLWEVLQRNTVEKIQRNPPSSGFIGIVVMLNLCEQVDIYEFIPSKRHTSLCHYYDIYNDMACTLGAYHPLLYEKLLVRRMTSTPPDELAEGGKAVLPGFSQITCQS